MSVRHRALAIGALGLLLGARAQAGYQVGGTIDPETAVVDAQLEPHPLLELFDPAAQVVVLVLFGAGGIDPDPPGELWCEDSQAELDGLRSLVERLSGEPVQFLGIAFPAAYSSEKHGFEVDVFLGVPAANPAHQAASRQLVAATEVLRADGKLPYERVYYDPRFLLLSNPEHETAGRRSEALPDWAGRFKADQDRQKYGLPTVWLLDPSGVVLEEAFTGNIYGDDPPTIRYTLDDLERAIRRQLGR
jgi:hypothetical protein